MQQGMMPACFLLLGSLHIITGLCDALFWGPQLVTPVRSIVSGLVMVVLSGAMGLLRIAWRRYRAWRHTRYASV
jgi:hypothetical protein